MQVVSPPGPVAGSTPRGAGLAAYAGLALPLAMIALPIHILLPGFYASQTGLALTTIGLLLLAARLIDAVADPLLGGWVDLQKRRGTGANPYRLPLLLAAMPLAVGLPLLFAPPASLPAGAWLFTCLVCSYIGYSLATIAYQAWGAELAQDDAGRTRVAGMREAVGLVGVLLGAALPAAIGLRAWSGTFVALLALGLVLALALAPPPAGRSAGSAAAHNPFASFLLPLQQARTRWLLAVFATNAMAPAVTATVFQFFVADRLQMPGQVGAFLAIYFLAGALGMPLWIRLAQRTDLRRLWLLGMVASVLAFAGAYAVPPGAFGAFALICVLSGLAFGADLALPAALLAQVIARNGHAGTREGVYFGLWNFVNKLVLALAGGIALPLLESRFGYVQGARDPQSLQALALTYAVLPCLLKLAAAGLLLHAWRRQHF